MADSKPWWFNRIGQVAGATVTSTNPEPQYGAAMDLSTANMSPQQMTDLLNDVQTTYDDREQASREQDDGTWWSALTGGIDTAMQFTGGLIGSGAGWVGDQIETGTRAVLPDPVVDAAGAGLGATGDALGTVWGGFEEGVEWWNQALATPAAAYNIAGERRDGFFDFNLHEGETWSEAWKRSEYTTLGQSLTETTMSADEREAFHRLGYDPETGQVKNAAYRELREEDPWYNIGSGGIDFLKVWFTDPAVIAGKAAGVGRSLVKADMDKMPEPIRRRFEGVVTAPRDELEKIKATSAAKYDPITRRAITVREGVNDLADRVRRDELSVPQLADMQAFQFAANGPTAANAFWQAAHLKRFDPESGWTDEFDYDTFDTTVAAMMGHAGAIQRLSQRRDEIGDSIKALYDQKMPSLDHAVRSASQRLAVLHSDDPSVGHFFAQAPDERLARIDEATFDVKEAVKDRELFEQELNKYDGYADWMTQAMSEVDVRMAPKEAYSVGQRLKQGTSRTYRGSSHAPYTQTVTSVPRAVFLKRAGVTDLHRPGDAFEAGRRYFDETLKIAGDSVEESARVRGFNNWGEFREDMLSRLAATTTDVERRALMSEVESVGFEAVARRHGLNADEAEDIVNQARELQRDLVSQAKSQTQERAYSGAKDAQGNRIDTFTYKDPDGKVSTLRLPVDVTQLENYYIAADLTTLNRMLRSHGDGIKAKFRTRREQGRELGVGVLSAFNHYWKPAVLFRLGYPMRTLTDESLRVLGATGSMGTTLLQTQAFARGLKNTPKRLVNRTRRAFDRHVTIPGYRRRYPLMDELDGPETVPDVLGAIDAPDPERFDALTRLGKRAEDWIQRDLHAQASLRPRQLFRRDTEDFDPADPRPQGTYYSLAESDDFRSPHMQAGDTDFEMEAYVADRDALDVPFRASVPIQGREDAGGVAGASVAAIEQLDGVDELTRLNALSRDELVGEIRERFPNTNLDRHLADDADFQDLLEVYGSQLAREKGYKALVARDPDAERNRELFRSLDPEERDEGLLQDFSELVDLTGGRILEPGRRARPPAYLERMDQRLRDFGESDARFLAMNPGNVRPVNQGNLVFPYENTRLRTESLDSPTLVRFINEHADVLSNRNAVLAIRKNDDGMLDVEIGFRVNKKTSKNPVRGVRFTDKDGNDLHEPPEFGRQLAITPEVGEGQLVIDGHVVEDGFGPHGGMYRPANSSAPHQASQHKSYEQHIGALRRAAGGARTYTPKDREFVPEWGRLVNQMKSSPIIQRILDEWEDDDIVNWLIESREGQKLMERLPHKAEDPERWVAELRIHADELLPTERLRHQAKAGEEISNEDLERMTLTPGTPTPQSIDGMAYELASGDGAIPRTINKFIENGYKVLTTLPTDTLVRNPFFLENYRHRMQQMLRDAPDEVRVTDELKQALESRAREHALNQTRKYLFSLADDTQFTHAFRFLSPFVGAWQETMVRWSRIFMERPESFGRIYMNGWENLNDIWQVESIDQNGQPDENGEFIRTPFPGVAKKFFSAFPHIEEEDLEGMTSMQIPKNSLSVSLQGEPFWLPSPGPMVQLPSEWIFKNSPHLADENAFTKFAWSWMFPIGMPESNIQAAMPAWVNQWWRGMQGIDDPVFQNLSMGIYKDEMYKWRGDGQVGPEPTFEDALEKAQGVQALYVAGRLTSPFSFQIQPESQLFIDKAREYREQYGWEEGLKRYTKEVGDDAYMWWTSMSKTNLNVPPTSEGFKGYQQWEDQINKHPDLAGLFVGLDATEDQFNYAVYERQQKLPVGPGDPRPQRGQKSPDDAIDEIEALQGWTEYREFKTAIESELEARGLTSIRQSEAGDLLQMQRAFIDAQREKLPGWSREYDQRDAGASYDLVSQMREAVQSGNVPDRPDWHGIEEYVQLHDAFAAELDARRVVGGSRDMTAQANEDLAQMWDAAVGDLVNRNLMFADVYHRHLDGHRLTDGSH